MAGRFDETRNRYQGCRKIKLSRTSALARLLTFLIITVCSLVISETSASAINSLSPEIFNKYNHLTTTKLMELGSDYFNSGKSDEALICFSIIISRLDNEKLTKETAEMIVVAYNNMGYLNSFCYFDYPKAYSNYSSALEISERFGLKQKIPTIRLNIAAILSLCEEYSSSISTSPQALEMYNKASKEARASSNWRALNIITNNLIFGGIMDSSPDSLLKYSKNWFDANVPNNSHYYDFTYHHCLAADAFARGDYSKAMAEYDSLTAICSKSNFDWRHQAMIPFSKAQIFEHLHEYDKAIGQLKDAEQMAREKNGKDVRVSAYYHLSRISRAVQDPKGADDFYITYLQLKDSMMQDRGLMKIENMRFLDELDKANALVRHKEKERQTTIMTSVCLSVIVLLAIFFLIFVIIKNKKLQSKNTALYELNRRIRQEFSLYNRVNEEACVSGEKASRENARQKYKNSPLDDATKDHIVRAIISVMENADAICSDGFSLATLSEMTGVNSAYLSQVIGERFEKNFNILLSEYRIREACRRFDDLENFGSYNIEGISQSVGFKSRSNFVQHFKKCTGLTPSEYLKKAREH